MTDASIEGLDKLFQRLTSLGADLKVEFPKAGKKGMLILEAATKDRCPVDTAGLQRSYTTEVIYEGDDIIIVTGTNLEYAIWVEFGTGIYAENGDGRKDPWFYIDARGEGHWTWGGYPQPHFRPALDQTHEQVLAKVKSELERACRKHVK